MGFFRTIIRRMPRNFAPYSLAMMRSGNFRYKARSKQYQGQTLGSTKRRGRVKSGQGITLQRDRSTIYTRKRAPRRVRSKYKKSFRAFKSKVLKMKGHRTLMTNQSVAVTGSAGQQGITSFVLYEGHIS